MVRPSGTESTGSRKVRAGRQQTVGCEPELVTWPPFRFSRMRCERGSVDVVLPASSPFHRCQGKVRCNAHYCLDIHRAFAAAVAWEDGRRRGRIDIRRKFLFRVCDPTRIQISKATGALFGLTNSEEIPVG
jgi:hypothetical protein